MGFNHRFCQLMVTTGRLRFPAPHTKHKPCSVRNGNFSSFVNNSEFPAKFQAQKSRSRAPRPKTTVHITEDRGLRPAVTAPRKIQADRTDTFDSRISMFACSLFLERLCAISCDLRVSSCRPLQGQAPLEALHECLEQISWRWPILATWLCLYGHLPICLRGPGPMQRLKLEGPEPQTAWMSQAPHT